MSSSLFACCSALSRNSQITPTSLAPSGGVASSTVPLDDFKSHQVLLRVLVHDKQPTTRLNTDGAHEIHTGSPHLHGPFSRVTNRYAKMETRFVGGLSPEPTSQQMGVCCRVAKQAISFGVLLSFPVQRRSAGATRTAILTAGRTPQARIVRRIKALHARTFCSRRRPWMGVKRDKLPSQTSSGAWTLSREGRAVWH